MAKIPAGENLGQLVAQPQRAVNVPAGAFGENIGREVAVAAGTELERQQIEARRAAIKREQEEKEAEAARKSAEKARANATLLAAQDDLQALHDDFAENVKTGKVSKDAAPEEWQRQATERATAVLETIPQEYRELATFQLDHKRAQLSRGVRKAVTARDQSDTLASIKDTLESTQRMYMRDPRAAQELTTRTLEELGPAAGLTTEQIRNMGQTWRETTTFTMASSMVGAARRNNRALDAVAQRLNGEEFADMDPQRKVSLLAQIEGFRASNTTQAEAAARRAEAAAERQMRQAEAEFNAGRTLILEGKALSGDWVQQAAGKMAGTPYAAAFVELTKMASTNAAFGSMPVTQMDATINGLRAKLNASGTDPKTEKQIKELEQIRDAAKRDYQEDPLPAALERGILDRIEPLDISSTANVVQGLTRRINQAQVVATRTGEPVSPLMRNEAEQVSKLIAALPVDQRASAIAEISQAAGPGFASAIGRQIAPKDKALGIAFGMAGDKTTAGRHTSEIVLRGAQALKDRSVKEDNAALTGVRASVAAQIGDAYTNDEVRQAMIDASVFAYYGLAAEGSADLDRAVRLATGGIAERNGKKLPLPYGVTQDVFEKKLRSIKPEDLRLPDGQVYIDGKPVTAAEFVRQVPDAALVNAGQGRYAVRAGKSLATRKDGRPVILEVR